MALVPIDRKTWRAKKRKDFTPAEKENFDFQTWAYEQIQKRRAQMVLEPIDDAKQVLGR